jgi:diaminopimelate epimerase
MSLEFHKMHGAGNDFVLIDARGQDFNISPQRATALADRRLGVGCDQILVLRDADNAGSHLKYEIWNSDGSPAAQCGNGARCVGLFLDLNGESRDSAWRLDSPSGIVSMKRCDDGEYEVDMGVPDFEAENVPTTLEHQQGRYGIESSWGRLEFSAASMGNPHALLIVDDISSDDIPEIGAFISSHDGFPEGCNAGFTQLLNRASIRLRVVERGAGETLACGSGACAAMAMLRQSGLVGDVVDVFLPGGRLVIKWRGGTAPVTMKGPAEHIFRGTMNE